MKKIRKNLAVSSVLGTAILLGMMIALFAVLQAVVLSYPFEPATPSANLVSTIDGEYIIIKHSGGESLSLKTKVDFIIGGSTNRITVSDSDYLTTKAKEDNHWGIGEVLRYYAGDMTNLRVDISIIDIESNSMVMRGTLQQGRLLQIPTVETLGSPNYGGGIATLNMNYDFKDYNNGDLRFSYKEEGAGTWLETSWDARSGQGSYSGTITGLVNGITYVYKAQLRYDSNIIEGEEESFTMS